MRQWTVGLSGEGYRSGCITHTCTLIGRSTSLKGECGLCFMSAQLLA
jgi:hypothetical protein